MSGSKLLKLGGLLLGGLILAEVGAGYLNFQRGSERGLGLAWLADRIKTRMRPADTRGISLGAVYQQENTTLRQVLEKSYAAEFEAFMETASVRACSVAVVYMPTQPPYPAARELYAALAEKAGVPFLDMQPMRERFGPELLYLTPADIHPSRLFGHLTANAVAEHIRADSVAGCQHDKGTGGALAGPWVAGLSEIRETVQGLAFRFHSNADGFRSAGSVAGEKSRSILVIGDSFTFGTSLADQDTWPTALQNRLPQHRVFNAGVGGISIVRQHDILKTATQEASADLIILQVNETDLLGLAPSYWEEMGRPPAYADEIAGFFP